MLTFTKYYYKNPSRLQQPKKQICTKIRIKTHGGLMRPLASYNKVVNGSRWRFCIVNTSSSLFLRLQLYLYSWGYIFIFILEATSLSLFLILNVLISTFQTKLIQNNFLGKPDFLNLIFFISNACNNSDIYYTVTLHKIQVLTCLTRDFLLKSWPEDFKTIP